MGFSGLPLTDIERVSCSKATPGKRAFKVCFFKLLSSSVSFSLVIDFYGLGVCILTLEPRGGGKWCPLELEYLFGG